MAKKKSKSKQFSLGNLQSLVENVSEKNNIMVEGDRTDESYIGTGIYILNSLLSKSILKGGVPKDRITVFAGDPSTGKSYICYNIARNAQKEGYYVLFIDTEHSANNDTFHSFGIDTNKEKWQLLSDNNVENMKNFMASFLDNLKIKKEEGYELPKMMIILDSVGNMASTKEVEDAKSGKNKQDMTRAKALKSLFRIISSDLGYLKIPMVATNQIYYTQDLFPQPVMTGGKGLEYAASTIVFLTNAKLKTGKEDEMDAGSSGVVVSAKAKKNRMAKPKKVKFEIDHTYGTNPYKGLDFFLTQENFEKTGIAKGKMVKGKDGKMVFEPGGSKSKWYVKHLDKTLYDKHLYNKEVFTDDVLKALDEIIFSYFKYSSYEELQEIQSKMEADKLSPDEENDATNDENFDLESNELFDDE